jgi:hypothetical protein
VTSRNPVAAVAYRGDHAELVVQSRSCRPHHWSHAAPHQFDTRAEQTMERCSIGHLQEQAASTPRLAIDLSAVSALLRCAEPRLFVCCVVSQCLFDGLSARERYLFERHLALTRPTAVKGNGALPIRKRKWNTK